MKVATQLEIKVQKVKTKVHYAIYIFKIRAQVTMHLPLPLKGMDLGMKVEVKVQRQIYNVHNVIYILKINASMHSCSGTH